MMSSTTAIGHHELRRRKSLLTIISMITFVCILSSIIVLFSSKLGTSNNLNIDKNYNAVSSENVAAGSSYDRSFALRRGGGVLPSMQSSAHRNMQIQTSQRCIKISIFLDEYPVDTNWIITDESTDDIVVTSPAYDVSMALTQQVETTCLVAPGQYSFTISDDYEDGLCCLWGEGNYTVSTLLPSIVGGNAEILASGDAWTGPNETTKFLLTEAPPTNMPTLQPTSALTLQPTMYIEPVERINVTSQVNVYLTGVPTNQNMTTAEQEVFETLFYSVLQSRLETVDVDVLKVVVDTQINDPLFDAYSPFDSDNNNGNGGGRGDGDGSVLQLLTNITFTYSVEPEGFRDWSIYLTSWIESFGPTMVDIFTDPKHDRYPNEEFFNSISDVSATNVVPPNTDPTMSPTLSPTYLGAPEYKKPLVTGLASAGVIAVVLFFAGALWWKQRRLKMTRNHDISSSNIPELHETKKDYDEDEDELESLDVEGNLHEEEDSKLQDVMLVSTLPSIVPKSNNDDMNDDYDDDEGVDDNNDSDEVDEDEVGSEEINVQASPVILEETPPRQEPLVAAAVPNELQDDIAQYDSIVEAVLANDPNLTQVVLDNKRQIGNNDGGEALWQALSLNNHVKVLSLQNSNITDDQMAALALALNENTSISNLYLQNNMFTSAGVEYLVVCLECNSTIQMVALEGNSTIDPRIIEELQGILQSRVGLANSVPNNVNKTKSVLERIRSKEPNLTELNLHGMGIGPNDTDAIMEALAGNVYLRKVDLSSNMIDDDGVSALSLALADDTSITHLCLADNRITSIGAEYLLCTLDTNTTIVDVDLTGNSIEAEVIAELNHALKLRRTVDGC
eukprot:scaffold1131_cov87-Skeletonema_menzelii.AAC.2